MTGIPAIHRRKLTDLRPTSLNSVKSLLDIRGGGNLPLPFVHRPNASWRASTCDNAKAAEQLISFWAISDSGQCLRFVFLSDLIQMHITSQSWRLNFFNSPVLNPWDIETVLTTSLCLMIICCLPLATSG